MFIRCLSKPAYREEFKGETERSTTAYVEVREDTSLGSTYKFTSRSEVWKDIYSNKHTYTLQQTVAIAPRHLHIPQLVS
ncbi:MAG: palindromic element RPE1 domain-containing protein [Rickettsia endosymbiont of Eriopis connexa]|nr:palindromic element RPE1 domain-containing protein [Rickettsia endosymbiont of Eriopis connexa]